MSTEMTLKDLEELKAKYPDLRYFRLNRFQSKGDDGGELEERHLPVINQAIGWIRRFLMVPAKRFEMKNSYTLKHECEEMLGNYTSNGTLIAAALFCGLKSTVHDHTGNCDFRVPVMATSGGAHTPIGEAMSLEQLQELKRLHPYIGLHGYYTREGIRSRRGLEELPDDLLPVVNLCVKWLLGLPRTKHPATSWVAIKDVVTWNPEQAEEASVPQGALAFAAIFGGIAYRWEQVLSAQIWNIELGVSTRTVLKIWNERHDELRNRQMLRGLTGESLRVMSLYFREHKSIPQISRAMELPKARCLEIFNAARQFMAERNEAEKRQAAELTSV